MSRRLNKRAIARQGLLQSLTSRITGADRFRKRSLRVEPLENRNLLAGDAAAACDAVDETPHMLATSDPAAIEWQLAEDENAADATSDAFAAHLAAMQTWADLDFQVELRVTNSLTGEAVTSARVGDIVHVEAILHLPEAASSSEIHKHMPIYLHTFFPAFARSDLAYDPAKVELAATADNPSDSMIAEGLRQGLEPGAILDSLRELAEKQQPLVEASFVVREAGAAVFTTLPSGAVPSDGQAIVPSTVSIYESVTNRIANDPAYQQLAEQVANKVQHATKSVEQLAAGARPTARKDTYNLTLHHGTLSIDAEHGVLANDGAADGSKVLLVRQATHGKASLEADGSFRYGYDLDRMNHISDSFAYVVINADGTSEFTEVEVRAENMPPIAEIRLQAIDASGNALSSVHVGQEFYLQAFVNDLREDSRGATKVFLDLSFDSASLEVAGPVEVHQHFNGESMIPGYYVGGPTATVGPGDIRVQGVSNRGPTPGELEVFRVPLRATAVGASEIKFDHTKLNLRPALGNPPAHLMQVLGTSLDVRANPLDVTGDGHVRSSDALAVINHLNAFGAGPAADGESIARSALDADRNNTITAADALAIINYLNAGLVSAEGEAAGESAVAGPGGAPESDWLGLLAEDITSDRKQ